MAAWEWRGSGYLTKGDALLASMWAEDVVEARQAYWDTRDEELAELERLGWPDMDDCSPFSC
jgi:hypothetical protein